MSISTRVFGDKSSSAVMLFVGGSGDSKDSYTKLMEQLTITFPHYKFITFSFQGVEEGIDNFLSLQIQDLKEVLYDIFNDKHVEITLIATSNGAFSTSHILVDKQFNPFIKNAILLDPADYFIDGAVTVKNARTWTGLQKYAPSNPTTATLLNKITSDVRVNVVNFTIRNYGEKGYVEKQERGVDNDKKYSRLNNEMVRSFYKNIPKENRGLYIEDNTLPHAFMRDGNLKKNIQRITEIILQCLNQY